jgi:hypothetical protein
MTTKIKTTKEIHYRCKKCGDEIYWNTHKKMIMCKCGALGVDGCEFYVRLIGDEKDREEIKKEKKHENKRFTKSR